MSAPARDLPVTAPTSREAAGSALATLAPQLGLAPGMVDLRIDRESERLLNDSGARGASRGNVVWLRDFDPRATSSHLTLAHELVHVAQARLGVDRHAARHVAETEADVLSRALVAGAMVHSPSTRIADALHFDGETPPQPPSLTVEVARNYADELRTLMRLLAQPAASANEAAQVLALLAPLEFETARVLVSELDGPNLLSLARGLNEDHARNHRREVLAAAGNFSAAQLADHGNGLRFMRAMRIDIGSLTPPEQIAAVGVLRTMPPGDLATLDGGDNGPDFRALRTSPLPTYDRTEAERRAARVEALRRGVGDDPSLAEDALYHRLSAALSRIDRARAQAALEILAGAQAIAVPDPRFSGAVPPPASAARMPVPEATLQNVIARLDQEGKIGPWIEALHQEDRAPGRQGIAAVARGFAMLIRARRSDLNIARIRELLRTSFWDWAILDWEARFAWDILSNMAPVEQARFQTLDEGRLYAELIDQLPDDIRNQPGFAGLVLVRGEDGTLADMSREAGTMLAAQAELINAFRAGIDDRPYELFVRLLELAVPAPTASRATGPEPGATSTPAATRPPLAPPSLSLLEAVVHRLDALGLIARLFENLSAGVKQDRRYWNDFATVLRARDGWMNRADLRRLLHTSSLWFIALDTVSFEEALFAFHILRALSGDQRHAFELEDRGAYAARIAGALSQSMLHEAGLSFAFTRPDERGETPLRRQLADPAAWNGEAVADLALMIQMAVSAGDFDWVFEQSHRQRAWTREPLGPLVERFQLYDERVGRTFPHPHTVSAAVVDTHYLRALFGTGAYELEEYTRPVEGVDPFTGEPMTYAETTGLRVTADLEQVQDNLGAPLSNGMMLARSRGPRVSIGMDNRAEALAQPNVVDIELSEPAGLMRVRAAQINLSGFAQLSTSGTLRTGPVAVSDLLFELRFVPGNLRQPRSGRFHLGALTAEEVVSTSAGEADPVGLRHFGVSGVDGQGNFQTAPLPDSPVLGHVFGLLWDLALNRPQLTDTAAHHTALIGATLSVGRIDAQGLHMGDTRLASLSVQGLTIAAGGNRAAHVRAQIFVLDQRIARARRDAPATVDALLAEQTVLQAQLRDLAPLETEMLALMSRMQAGERLSAVEQARLDALQAETGIGGAGGVAVDIASMTADGLEGPVRIGHAALTNIHGGGESAALAFQQLTSGESIARFVRDGAPARARFGAGAAAAGLSFTADDFHLADVTIPATIPTLAEIDAQIGATPPPVPLVAERLARLRPLVEQYQALRAYRLDGPTGGETTRTPAEQTRLLELARRIGAILDYRIADVSVTGPTFRVGERGGEMVAGVGAGRIALTGITGPGLSAREGQSLVLDGFDTDLRMAADGLHIENFRIGSLAMTALDWSNGTHHIWSDRTSTMTGITADILLRARPAGAGGFDWRNVHIARLNVPRVEGAGLGYERLEGGARKFDLRIDSGALLGLALTDFDIDMTGAETVNSGRVDIAGFDAMRFRFRMRETIEAAGLLDRAVGGPPGVRVDMATDGTMTVNLDALVASDTDVTYRGEGRSGGGLHITRGDLSGGVVMSGDDIRLNTLHLQRIEFARIHWRTASGTTIRSDRPTVATDVRFTGRYSTLSETSSEFAIDSFHIGRLSSSQLVVDAGSVHLELPEPTAAGAPMPDERAALTDIDVSNLLIGMDATGTRIGPADPARRAHASIGGASTSFLLDYAHDLQVRGMLTAGRMDFWFDPGNAIEARMTGMSGAGTVRYGDRSGPGHRARELGADAGFDFHGFDSGLIRYQGNVVTIGGNGGAPLHLDSLNLGQLEIGGPAFEVFAPDTSMISATDIGARIEVHLHPTPVAATAARTPYEKIIVNELTIGNVSASGMRIHLIGMDLWLDLPEDEPFNVGPILVGRPADRASGQPLEIVPVAGGGMSVTGRIRAEALRADHLQAQLTGSLNARMNFAAEALEVGFAGAAGTQVDLLHWSLTQISGYVAGDPTHRLKLRRGGAGGTRYTDDAAGLFADRLSYNSATGGHVTLAGLNARGMRYDDEPGGVHLDIRRIDAPDIVVDLGPDAFGRRVISIPSATITDAFFELDHLSDGSGSGGGTPSPYFAGNAGAAWLQANHALFESLNGSFEARGRYGLDGVLPIPGLDYSFNFNVPVTNGSINYNDLEGQMPGIVDAAVDFRLEGNVLKLGAGFTYYPPGDPDGMGDPPDPIPLYTDFIEWHLDEEHLREVRGGRIDLDALARARSVGPPSPTPATPTPAGSSKTAPLILDHLALNARIDNPAEVPIGLGSLGTATLAPHGMQGLSLHGMLQALRPIDEAYPSARDRAIHDPSRPGAIGFALDSIDLSSLDLRFPTRGRGAIGVTTGAIHIGAISHGRIRFAGLDPQWADGTLTNASVTNLIVTLSPDTICPIPEAPRARPAGAPALDTPDTFRPIDEHGYPTRGTP